MADFLQGNSYGADSQLYTSNFRHGCKSSNGARTHFWLCQDAIVGSGEEQIGGGSHGNACANTALSVRLRDRALALISELACLEAEYIVRRPERQRREDVVLHDQCEGEPEYFGLPPLLGHPL